MAKGTPNSGRRSVVNWRPRERGWDWWVVLGEDQWPATERLGVSDHIKSDSRSRAAATCRSIEHLDQKRIPRSPSEKLHTIAQIRGLAS